MWLLEIGQRHFGCRNDIVVRLLIALLLTVSTSPVWARARITAVKVSPEFRPFSERVKAYMELHDRADKAIGPLKDKSDAVGYVFAINGKVYCADVYGSAALSRYCSFLRSTLTPPPRLPEFCS